ncbi:MAG: fibrobacter succinogenes major paralogous domain-containing protein [Fibrobacter sp.]|uniref:fibrobacter succinogenes major paralogous domain-containing protein n=1 Tax=Fibrobacter sp. TaxID=35828 RepID=UPI0025B8C0B8|nr:fibrobacter succinogenes major paralogous domain-containing protein [Fibrobacter sp.]MBR4784022.1 fibrobacter succinogenes major paralogous domain-containing protein [Fibrobacter sp.]
MSKLSPWSKRSAAIGSIAFLCAALFVACSDDDSSFATRPSDWSSSSVCDDCDDGSSSSAKSSSSSVKSSSSAKSSSSSVELSSSSRIGCKTETEDNCEYGELVDDRDGQTYKTVKIGDQWWMAENLNYAFTDVPYSFREITSDSTSWCYDNDSDNCTKYGRFYTWAIAMDSVGIWSGNGKDCGSDKICSPTYPVRGICPEGWHLPDNGEWDVLFTVVGGGSKEEGKVLKSTSGWDDYYTHIGNGTDVFGFSALPTGGRSCYGGKFNNESFYAIFWSSTEYDSDYGNAVSMAYAFDYAVLSKEEKPAGISVRCIQN